MLSLYIYITSVIIGALIWSVRLEGRITTGDQKTADVKELIGSQLLDISRRLDRIERGMNGHLPRE